MNDDAIALGRLVRSLDQHNTDLRAQVDVAKNLQQSLIDDLSIEKVIKTVYRIGLGTKEDPVRVISSYWDMDGNHLFSLEDR